MEPLNVPWSVLRTSAHTTSRCACDLKRRTRSERLIPASCTRLGGRWNLRQRWTSYCPHACVPSCEGFRAITVWYASNTSKCYRSPNCCQVGHEKSYRRRQHKWVFCTWSNLHKIHNADPTPPFSTLHPSSLSNHCSSIRHVAALITS